jgi:hypothetical protein
MALVKGIYHSVGAPLFAFRVSLFRRFSFYNAQNFYISDICFGSFEFYV